MTWQSKVLEFARAVQHGDAVHRAWLLEAAECFIDGRPLPPPRSAKDVPQWDGVDPRCQQYLRAQGKPYPRTCAVCGLGQCTQRLERFR